MHDLGSVSTDVGAGGGFRGRSGQRGLAAQGQSATANAKPEEQVLVSCLLL